MDSPEEKKKNKSAQSTEIPPGKQNWTFTMRCQAAAFDLSEKDFSNTDLAKVKRKQQ